MKRILQLWVFAKGLITATIRRIIRVSETARGLHLLEKSQDPPWVLKYSCVRKLLAHVYI